MSQPLSPNAQGLLDALQNTTAPLSDWAKGDVMARRKVANVLRELLKQGRERRPLYDPALELSNAEVLWGCADYVPTEHILAMINELNPPA
jgi:hypothetical protein